MAFISNLLLVIQWIVFLAGFIATPFLFVYYDLLHAMVSLSGSMAALSSLKMEVFTFAAPRRR